MCFLVHVAVCLSISLSLFINTIFTFNTNHCEVEAMFCVIMIRKAFNLNISCNYYENKINCYKWYALKVILERKIIFLKRNCIQCNLNVNNIKV